MAESLKEDRSGGLIIRKLVSALFSCILVMFIFFLIEPSGFVIMIGMYLFLILLLYGLPSSILSDFVTKKLKGMVRGGLALVIHLILATAFVMILFTYAEGWEPVNFFLLLSLLSFSGVLMSCLRLIKLIKFL